MNTEGIRPGGSFRWLQSAVEATKVVIQHSSEQQQRPHSAGTMESDQMESEMAERRARFSSERWGFFGCDVSAVEDFNKRWDDLMSMRSIESVGSGVSSKRVRSKRGLIDFNESSLPRRVNFKKKHNVSDDEDWIKSSDDLEEMNQELSSEVRWKHV